MDNQTHTPLDTPLRLRHPYFDVAVGLARSCDSESYAGSSLLLVGSSMPVG